MSGGHVTPEGDSDGQSTHLATLPALDGTTVLCAEHELGAQAVVRLTTTGSLGEGSVVSGATEGGGTSSTGVVLGRLALHERGLTGDAGDAAITVRAHQVFGCGVGLGSSGGALAACVSRGGKCSLPPLVLGSLASSTGLPGLGRGLTSEGPCEGTSDIGAAHLFAIACVTLAAVTTDTREPTDDVEELTAALRVVVVDACEESLETLSRESGVSDTYVPRPLGGVLSEFGTGSDTRTGETLLPFGIIGTGSSIL